MIAIQEAKGSAGFAPPVNTKAIPDSVRHLAEYRTMHFTKTVLLVDDDTDILHALRTVLERKGYRVLTATDGNMGLAVAEREGPDLVVVDMMMPKKSGFLVLEKLKSRPEQGPRVI